MTREPAVRDLGARAEVLAAEIERLAESGRIPDELPAAAVQRLLGALTRAYVSHLERGSRMAPFTETPGVPAVTATEAVATASQMLRALDLEVFELAMWQSQGGLPTTNHGEQR